MRKIILKVALIVFFAPIFSYAQTANTTISQEKQALSKPYNENEDAFTEIQKLIQKAQKEKKNIILQAGGNWCIWCLRFHSFIQNSPELKQLIEEKFLYYHLNLSPKNKNDKAFAKYAEDGKKLGYPFFVILDQNGNRLHSQESEILEEGNSYSFEKVKDFLQTWIK